VRVLSFTHAVAGPTVGRTLAEQGADVLGATRPNDYEHEFIYAEANLGLRSAYVDWTNRTGGSGRSGCWPTPTWSSTTTGRVR
jgi:crotonobetainyl-CoA:carnitine CoA-transferase CaiB-like acyl-CoA transferase